MVLNKQHKEVFVLAVLSLLSGWLFVWLAQEVIAGKMDLFDKLAFNYFRQWMSPAHTTIALLITHAGSDASLIAIYLLILGYLLKNKFNWGAIQLLIVASGSFLWTTLLKQFFHRPRPSLPHLDKVRSYSFPSGHTLETFTLCGILIYMAWQTKWSFITKSAVTVALVLFACLVGISRVYLHVHFISDVIAGGCFALCWLTFSAVVIKLKRSFRN